jgi:hypothetical protein
MNLATKRWRSLSIHGNSYDIIHIHSNFFILRGVPAHIRPDNGPEFTARTGQAWITAVGTKTAYMTPGSPWGEAV